MKKYWLLGGVLLVVIGVGAFMLISQSNKGQASPIKTVVNKVKPKPADSDPNAVKKAVIAYSDAYLGGHGNAAYNLLSHRCAKEMTAEQMIGLALTANQAYGQIEPENITIKILEKGKATASYTYPNAASINQTNQSWLFENGGWRYDGCPA